MKKYIKLITIFFVSIFFFVGCYSPKVEEFVDFSSFSRMDDSSKQFYFPYIPENISEDNVKKIAFIFFLVHTILRFGT